MGAGRGDAEGIDEVRMFDGENVKDTSPLERGGQVSLLITHQSVSTFFIYRWA